MYGGGAMANGGSTYGGPSGPKRMEGFGNPAFENLREPGDGAGGTNSEHIDKVGKGL